MRRERVSGSRLQFTVGIEEGTILTAGTGALEVGLSVVGGTIGALVVVVGKGVVCGSLVGRFVGSGGLRVGTILTGDTEAGGSVGTSIGNLVVGLCVG